MKERVKVTEHPHVVQVEGKYGRRAFVKGTRIPVSLVAFFFKTGSTPDEILLFYPHLTAAQVYDAISYYLDHQREIEEELQENEIERVLKGLGLTMDEDGRIREGSESEA